MELVELTVSRLENSVSSTGAFLMHLKEKNVENGRILPIVIGAFEAQAIIFGLEKNVNPPRPITHDLFYNVLQSLGYKLEKVVISQLKEGVFYSTIFLSKDGQTFEFDSRTSDAVALAVRFQAPIYAVKEVMDEAGVLIKERKIDPVEDFEEEIQKALEELFPDEEEEFKTEIQEHILDRIKQLMRDVFGRDFDLSQGSKEDLEKMLQKAIENEDYELAAKLRDVIKKMEDESNDQSSGQE